MVRGLPADVRRGEGHPVQGGAMNGATVIRWGAGVPGREAKGLEVFGKAIEFFEGLSKTGRIHGHREYIAFTGGAGGFMLIEGETKELLSLLAEPEVLALNSQAEAIVQDFSIQVYGGGSDSAIQELIGTYSTAVGELGYM
ncbi:MAG: hypothetical protein M3P04_08795 [Actinomycetota bacterium]|nr:hypothetical protein [Actinomycetota bacterium]